MAILQSQCMSRLPTPGGDSGAWGIVLNDFLSVSHGTDGKLKNQVTNVKDFGAIGDGTSRPLSTIYATLAAAQSAHPTAAALSDELDGVATQTAINYLRDHGGGTLSSPRGTYICNTEILLPKAIIYDSTIVQQVNWIGEGFASKYKWSTDLGVGKWAVRPADGTLGGTGYKCDGLIKDIVFYGPNETFTLGVAPCNMKGVMGGAQRKLENVGSRYFYAGICIAGDHSQYKNVQCHYNYYGGYWENPYTNLYGDFLFEGLYLNGCAFAAIGIDYRANPQGTFIKCYIGGAPYGIYKECNGITSYSSTLKGFTNSSFVDCMFEFIGNAMISDESEANGGAPVSYWYTTTFERPFFNWRPSDNLSSKAKTSVIGMGKAERIEFLEFKETFGWTPGTLGVFNLARAPGVFIKGNITGLIAAAAGSHVFAAHSDATMDEIHFQHIGPTWDGTGRARICTTGQTWIVGDVLMEVNNTASLCTASIGLLTNGFCGIALEANDGTANNVCLVAEEGLSVPVNADVVTLLSSGYSRFVKMSATDGKVGAAVNISDSTVIGYYHAATNGTGGANGIYNVHLFTPPLINRPLALPIRLESGTSVTMSAQAAREGYVRFTAAGAVTYTIPTNATAPMPIGVAIRLWAAGIGGVTVSPAGGVILNGTATITQNTGRVLIQVSTDVWDIV